MVPIPLTGTVVDPSPNRTTRFTKEKYVILSYTPKPDDRDGGDIIHIPLHSGAYGTQYDTLPLMPASHREDTYGVAYTRNRVFGSRGLPTLHTHIYTGVDSSTGSGKQDFGVIQFRRAKNQPEPNTHFVCVTRQPAVTVRLYHTRVGCHVHF